MKRIKNVLVFAGSMVAVAAAHAADGAIDTTTITAGIVAVSVAILAVIAALTSLSVSIFGVSKMYAFIKRKAGA